MNKSVNMLQSTLQTYYNPLGLIIGQEILISHESLVEYNYDSSTKVPTKQVQRKSKKQRTFVIGVIKKALGTYSKGSPKYFNGEYDYYEQPSLTVSRYIWLYQTRQTLKSEIILVSPEDISII